jgi:epoxyqueuosine reductase
MRHDVTMDRAQRTSWIADRAHAVGFDLCGVAALDADAFSPMPPRTSFAELRHLPEWLARGYAGEMKYLHDPRRADPRSVVPGARSIIVAAMNYHAAAPLSTTMPYCESGHAPRGWISRYAWGDDYHEMILTKLNTLISEMHAHFDEPFDARAYVDTGPIVERIAAKYAGLGWLAKNTCLINRKLGSWLFLGVIITTLDLQPSIAPGEAPPADLCGSCTRCLDACPTHAFPEPYVLDARRCISYLTIELRGSIPEDLRSSMGSAVIGCDICQDVCPWNRKAPVTQLAAFQPRELTAASHAVSNEMYPENGAAANEPAAPGDHHSLLAPELEWLASLSQQQFSEVFRRSAVKRAKWRGLARNVCVALGNSNITAGSADSIRVVRLLERLAASEDALIAEHARWALDRIGAAPAITNQQRRH